MENAEERKKMKKIEKEEQLKKKLEQTMEEKMAADSKTVEGESAVGKVGKAEEENTATEQEQEAAPALSEEELNAMYERFQQRLQKEGLADAEGNPTEKTLEIRRQIVAKKVEREKQAEKQAEKQKKIAKRAKTTKHWVRTAKAAGVVLVVGACVFGASMTSEANRIRLVETISGVRNTGDVAKTNNGEERKYTEEDLDKIKRQISETLHISVPEFYYVPRGMKYSKTIISEETQMAVIKYSYNEHSVYFHLAANEKDLSQGNWKDRETVKVETLDEMLEVEMGSLSENDEDNYYALWKYKDAYYELSGQIEKEELIKILNEMQYNL